MRLSRIIIALSCVMLFASPALALSPKVADFLRSAGIDPNSDEVKLVDAEGTVHTSYQGDPVYVNLEKLAAEGAKNGARRFVVTRTFIRRLKADFAGTKVPQEGYDGLYLTLDERQLALKKVFPD